MLRRVSVEELRAECHEARDLCVLCGAGISMIAPTCLPSGDHLRDLCIRGILSDRFNKDVLDRLMSSNGYKKLLPEAVLQDIGLFASAQLDRLMTRIIESSAPNPVHQAMAEAFDTVFTTNFDACLETVGARNVVHLHGSINAPSTLQNRIFRLGKGRDEDVVAFRSSLQDSSLVILGYSLRDKDITEAIIEAGPRRVLFLSYDGWVPPFLDALELPRLVATGSAEDLFCVESPKSQAPPEFNEKIRQPSVGARASALLYLAYLSGNYSLAPIIIETYGARLKGRLRYKALCSAADSLRILRRFAECEAYCRKVLRSRFCGRLDQVDLRCTAHNLMALCALDQGDEDLAKVEVHFSKAIEALESFAGGPSASGNEIGIAIFKARIQNNLGLLKTRQGSYLEALELFGKSLEIKSMHHDDRGLAQTHSNMAKCYCLMEDWAKARAHLDLVIALMGKAPDLYVCEDAISEIMPVVCGCLGLPHGLAEDGSFPNPDQLEWDRFLGEAKGFPGLLPIIQGLKELSDRLSTIKD